MLEKWHFDVICKSKRDNAYAIVLRWGDCGMECRMFSMKEEADVVLTGAV